MSKDAAAFAAELALDFSGASKSRSIQVSAFELPAARTLPATARLSADLDAELVIWFRSMCRERNVSQRAVLEKLIGAFRDHHS